ncbi:MAG: 4-(cytidine 5'-diphospho)-2-C-methyl-D-erythritol kinase [Planctomycetes bacterium]|nr:4-(cytidine 5'-diphospho)-2-C-methyl-D-erythritol kinase [Planctomycetota bacterium]
MSALAVDTPAKINLHLEVLGRRPDGYHEVVTVLHALALCDTLVAERCAVEQGSSLTMPHALDHGLPVTEGPDNLVLRAARAFAAEVGGAAARFCLHKRIPAGGGLGGGSSDAAAALRLLNRLHGDPLDGPALQRLAASLGADVPFFLFGGTMLGVGRGDRLEPWPNPPNLHLLLLVPPGGTRTPAVYENLRAQLTSSPPQANVGSDKIPNYKDLPLRFSGLRNDLERSAFELHPELARVQRRIVGSGYPSVRMSGSGSTLFLAFEEEGPRDDACGVLASLQDEGVALVRTCSGPPRVDEPRPEPFPGRDGQRRGLDEHH